jgi:hypothetical protein
LIDGTSVNVSRGEKVGDSYHYNAHGKIKKEKCPFYGTGQASILVSWKQTDDNHAGIGHQEIQISWRYSCKKDEKNCCSEGIPFSPTVTPVYNQ